MMKKLSFLLLSCFLSACSMHSVDSPRSGNDLSHTVTYQGENLGRISEWYTGSFSNWARIAARNPQVSPTALRLGDQVYVPVKLLKKRDPMPKSFLKFGLKGSPETAPVKPVNTKMAKVSAPLSPAQERGKLKSGIAKRVGTKKAESTVAKIETAPKITQAEAVKPVEASAVAIAKNEAVDPDTSEASPEPASNVFVCRAQQCGKADVMPDPDTQEQVVAEVAKEAE